MVDLTQFQIDNAVAMARELGGDRAQAVYLGLARSMMRDVEKIVETQAAFKRLLMHGQFLTQENEQTIHLALECRKSDLEWQEVIARAMAATIDPREKASLPPTVEALDMYSIYCGS